MLLRISGFFDSQQAETSSAFVLSPFGFTWVHHLQPVSVAVVRSLPVAGSCLVRFVAGFVHSVGLHGDGHASGSGHALPRGEVIPLHGDRDDLFGDPIGEQVSSRSATFLLRPKSRVKTHPR